MYMKTCLQQLAALVTTLTSTIWNITKLVYYKGITIMLYNDQG